MALDYAVIAAYVLGMIGMGWWGMRRATTKSEYLVAGRRLGFAMYSGTMSAVVLGGASTIGGVGLGYKYGISGAWMVFAIGLGILLLSALFARRIVKLKVYTVSQMLDLRYGGTSSTISGTAGIRCSRSAPRTTQRSWAGDGSMPLSSPIARPSSITTRQPTSCHGYT